MVIQKRSGFTIIELLVVMTIIAVVAVLSVEGIKLAYGQQKYTQAQVEMRDIRAQMEIFIFKRGQLPPMGDCCPGCSDPPNSSWTNAINAMRNEGLIDQTRATEYYTDPWGSYYSYDDNFGQNYATTSTFCTVGPDRRRGNNGTTGLGTGDDYCAHINHESVCLWSC